MTSKTLNALQCAEKISNARRIVALTGAGMSTAAGIPDFRGPKGLYVTRKYDPETVFDISFFRRNPRPFFDFTRDFLGMLGDLEPTMTHRFLAELEDSGRVSAVVTQNIDSLHQKAGSTNVISVHGDYWNSHCLSCNRHFALAHMGKAVAEHAVPRCDCGGVIKPDVVFFGEAVRNLDQAAAIISECDLLLVLGSTLAVYPAAVLPEYAGGEVVVVNQGDVSLAPARDRYFIDESLDRFFEAVSRALKEN